MGFQGACRVLEVMNNFQILLFQLYMFGVERDLRGHLSWTNVNRQAGKGSRLGIIAKQSKFIQLRLVT